MTEDRGQRTEDRGQRTEDRGQRTDNYFYFPGNNFFKNELCWSEVLLDFRCWGIRGVTAQVCK
ncbi:hypothetical protein LEP1GSC047_3181 [Leptospira inadai serovar Lyme str. 10]|uniref:Uncharacterized protein n=1 Tax=Leptospira inadai serovar Lyme str. 10 TaxID=1049790 RepID=V6HVU3_9LEPT|nr:hypothetical protein LEP1GSC047_3181 [Leptospira inadai serovar Lyme str. 10]